MAVVTGKIVFDPERSLLDDELGIPAVTVALRQEDSGLGLLARSDRRGFFRFTGLPAGSYRLTESYGIPAVTSVVDFADATPLPVPFGQDPPLSAVPSAIPPGVNRLASLTPNTRLFTLKEEDSRTFIFFDGPQTEAPAHLPATTGENLFIQGDLGETAPGSRPNSRLDREPFPDQVPGFRYTNRMPNAGEYTYTNLTAGGFGRHTLADHSTGQETGWMLLTAPSEQSGSAFTQTVELQPGRRYLFSLWAATDERFDPSYRRKIELTAQSSNGILLQKVLTIGGRYLPRWQQLGGVFTCGPDPKVTLRVEPITDGGLLYLDDFSLSPLAEEPSGLCLSLQADRVVAPIGSTTAFTAHLYNQGAELLSQPTLSALAPAALGILRGVQVNGKKEGWEQADLAEGIALPDLTGGQQHIIEFEGVLEDVPDGNPIPLTLRAEATAPDGETKLAQVLNNLWASDRCFCQCLCGHPALGRLCQGDLTELLGLSQQDVKKALSELGGDCSSVEAVLRKLGVLR